MPDSYDVKMAKFCYLCTFWPVIQLKKHIFEIGQKALKDVFLFCGNTSNFRFLRSNGILWVTSNMVYKKNPAA